MKKFLLLILFLGMYNVNYSNNGSMVTEEFVKVVEDNKEENIEMEENVEKEEQSSFEHIQKFDKSYENITLNLEFDKYFDKNLNQFAFIKATTNIRDLPSTKDSKVVGKIKNGIRLPLLGVIKGDDEKEWLEVMYKDEKHYIYAKNAEIRGFNWQKAVEKANKVNDFIISAIKDEKDIYYLHSYISLNIESDGKEDKYGNVSNQSIRAYYDNNKEYINLPDRSLFTLEGEDDNYVHIKTLSYGDEIYKIPKMYIRRLKKSNISEIINKFIYIDRNSQTQVSIERNKETNIFNVNTVGYVTTGTTKGVGFVTPYGDFLVAYTKPVMLYTSDFEREDILNSNGEKIGERPIIIGDAKFAIRFSGGGYSHGIPSTFEPKENRKERKKMTESKLGTIPLSHKCVRNADDVMEYLYKWVNGNGKTDKNGFTYPEENVIVIVD
ncbi:L,D-transpeptidase family protein [Streptobacillus notomytis]|uniref:L,D-transpeptidase family protein n=1 Tax=Streptobacillus notomytis TaxID=1712031 RepID=UPI0008349B87|nr:L,D-transpeptidase [Streptobacillus notomytis]